MYIYIYIYIEREMCIYIYIYIHIYVYTFEAGWVSCRALPLLGEAGEAYPCANPHVDR